MKTGSVALWAACFRCISMLNVQASETNTITDTGRITYREFVWSNSLDMAEPVSNVPLKDYQVIVVLPEKEMESSAEAEGGESEIGGTNTVQIHSLSAYDWLAQAHSTTHTNKTTPAGTPPEKPVQILVIEPVEEKGNEQSESLRLREYSFGYSDPQPEWHEWLKPRLFLNRWAELWTTETNAAPVVLILIPF